MEIELNIEGTDGHETTIAIVWIEDCKNNPVLINQSEKDKREQNILMKISEIFSYLVLSIPLQMESQYHHIC